ncbi:MULTISPECIES: hypothetical protein [Paraburkholderia]|uniref:Uncharacterized protein n=1 Tax=Paraburkholderia podalyriae TaxID=1938811 RepID=A0ABR7PTH2_9BURK|nr:hypothetical protein [Paraburkholderia podalyriae]MBC8749575.1 hypothetical protein [Paraburkholderia podalyriae]
MVLWRISNHADLKGETLLRQEIGSTADVPDTYQLLRVQVDDGVTISEIAEATCPPEWRDD